MRRALVLLAACGGAGTPAPTGPITASVEHYDYRVDLDARTAHSTLRLAVSQGGDCLTLPLRATMPAAVMLDGMAAKSVTADGTSIVACGAGVATGDTLLLDMDETFDKATLGPSNVGFSTTNDAQGNPFTYLVSWVGGCDRFGPCDNLPDRFATYHFDVTHSATVKVRCPGEITEVSATETECTFDHDGGPTYSTFGIAAYPAWTQSDLGMWGGVHVTLYDRAQTGIAAKIDSAYHSGYLTYLQGLLGPYPYGSDLRLLTAPTYWNGFEHPGNIVLNDTLAMQTGEYANNVQHVIDHEMTHMWAGDQTTLAGVYDFVWKESMAEYLAFAYEDGNAPSVSHVTSNLWKNTAQAAKFYPVPGGGPALFTYYGDVYGSGPMILFRQLEVMTSRAQVLAAIASVLGHAHTLSVDDLVAALSAKTGLDLTGYAAAWIHGSGMPTWPRFQLTFTQGAGATSTLVVHLVNPSGPAKGCKFHVELDGASGQTQLVAVDTFANGVDQTLTVPTPAFTVTAQRLDPQNECLVFLDSSTPRRAPPRAWIAEDWLHELN